MSNFEFEDILNMQYPNSEIEKDFPDKILRAAQFAPFAALTGYDEAVKETARLTDQRIELDEYEKNELNRRLNYIKEHIEDEQMFSITYFLPDTKKVGGRYVTTTDFVVKIRDYESTVVMYDKTEIPIPDILMIESDVFSMIE